MEIEPQLTFEFPGLQVLESETRGVKIKKSDQTLDSFRKDIQDKIRASFSSLEEVKNHRIFRAYRDFYWKVGIDPTKTRPAGEALARRIISGKDLPTINTLVDAYNVASAESYVAIAAFDLAKIHADKLLMRRATKGVRFLGIRMDHPVELSGIEIVIEDTSSSELIALYPYRDSESSKVSEESKNVLLMMCGVPGVNDKDLIRAEELSHSYIDRFCKSH